MQGKRTIQSAGQQIVAHSKLGGDFIKTANPKFIEERVKIFSEIKQSFDKILAEVQKPQITISLKDGKQIKGQAFVTTPYIIAKSISKNLAEAAIVARVKYTKRYDSPFGKGPVSAEVEDIKVQNNEYQLVDMTRVLEGDCLLQLITFQDKIGKQVFWHSSAHLLGQSLENIYGAWLCHGPPLENGFFYDSFIGNNRLSQSDYDSIEKEVKKFATQKQPYERILLTKKQALQLFAYNPFKVELIKNKVPEDGLTSAYRCGNLIDLCTGPHLPSADRVKGFKVTKNSSAYWLGNKQNDDLQRVYAISFPKQSQLDEYLKSQQELAKRDHRNVGPHQQLFNFTTLAPGSAMFFPHGTVIYNRLVQLMRGEYKIRGYDEVISPNLYNTQLWKMSGHYFKYKENIFFIKEAGQQHGLKPMNCPGHCVMFDMVQKSYRDLPLRMADFGVLHRNELHGALSGLTRVRRFQQDDAHIFCRTDQIQVQILGVLDLLDYIYSVFGFKFSLQFSTRPEKYLGSLQDWNLAESSLKAALDKFGMPYKLNEGDGAFYGPKIDVKLLDVFGREHQCGTVQLDFQLPIRFNLQYRIKEVKKQQEKPTEEKIVAEGETQVKPAGGKDKKKPKVEISAEQIQLRKKQKAEKKLKEDAKKEGKTEEAQKTQVKAQKVEHKIEEEKPEQTLDQMQIRYSKVGHLKNGFTRPVIIHRAIFGSLERFIAILVQHTGGKWDFWVSPRQLQLIPIGNDAMQFAQKIYNTFLLKGYSVSIDRSNDTFNKKIKNGIQEQFNYLGIIGDEELKSNSVNLRKRDEVKEIGRVTIPDLLTLFETLSPPKSKKRLALEEKSLKL